MFDYCPARVFQQWVIGHHASTDDPSDPYKKVAHLTHLPMTHRPIACSRYNSQCWRTVVNVNGDHSKHGAELAELHVSVNAACYVSAGVLRNRLWRLQWWGHSSLVSVNVDPKVTNHRHLHHWRVADAYWSSWDLMLTPSRWAPQHLSLGRVE